MTLSSELHNIVDSNSALDFFPIIQFSKDLNETLGRILKEMMALTCFHIIKANVPKNHITDYKYHKYLLYGPLKTWERVIQL